MVIADLRRYLFNKIGNEFIVDYDPGTKGTYRIRDRLRIRYDGRCVCSIYDFEGDPERYTVIFYEPFIHRPEGYSSTVTLKADEIIWSIKNRTDIYNSKKDNGKNKFVPSDSMVDKVLSQCKGGFVYANPDKEVNFRNMYPTMKISITVNSFIKDVIFNDPATIVFWVDGSKTVVKCQKGETFDPEKGLAMAISKKVLGNDYGYYETFAKYVGRYNKKHKEE